MAGGAVVTGRHQIATPRRCILAARSGDIGAISTEVPDGVPGISQHTGTDPSGRILRVMRLGAEQVRSTREALPFSERSYFD